LALVQWRENLIEKDGIKNETLQTELNIKETNEMVKRAKLDEEKKCVQTLKDDPNDLEVADILLNESSEMKTLPTLDDDVQKSATIDLEWKEKKSPNT